MKEEFIEKAFIRDGKEIEGPVAAMSLLSASSMRFRWNEKNERRKAFLKKISGKKTIAQVELIHSKTVYAVENADELFQQQGDGIITRQKNLVPVITVADCMPLFLYEEETGVFGVLHSGWKGTGIVKEALDLARSLYGSKAENFSVILGPHIHKCCYLVDEERAAYFSSTFTPSCVEEDKEKKGFFRLSLADANLSILEKAGVRRENIFVSDECTCCTKYADSSFKYGSFRREAGSINIPFTVQAAWIKWND